MHIPTGDCMLFSVSGAQLKFFRAKTPPEEAVGMVGTEVGALFRSLLVRTSFRTETDVGKTWKR